MILHYGKYTIEGTNEEINKFIRENAPTRVTSSANEQYYDIYIEECINTKKKIKDLTIGEVFEICKKNECWCECPLVNVDSCVCDLVNEELEGKLNDEIEIEVEEQ